MSARQNSIAGPSPSRPSRARILVREMPRGPTFRESQNSLAFMRVQKSHAQVALQVQHGEHVGRVCYETSGQIEPAASGHEEP
jgi:hypothetical protein